MINKIEDSRITVIKEVIVTYYNEFIYLNQKHSSHKSREESTDETSYNDE